MSLPLSTSKKSYTPNLNKIEGAKKGKLYEIISLLTLAKKGYELSIDGNTKFRNFCIGREVRIGKYRKLDDVVFSYVDQENIKNLIFLQLKHCPYCNPIDSCILSTEADTAKDVEAKAKASATRLGDVRYGYMCKYFNLQQYFISFLCARNELANTNTEELKNGKIKYVVLFTNSDLDIKELKGKGFSFNKAPDDIVDLLTLSSETERHCYQLGDVSEGLRKRFEKSSDLDRLARELARYAVCEEYREKQIMGIHETSIKYYHVALEREVIQKSTLKQVENRQYFREAQFRDDFLDCDQTAPNLHQLRKALFEAIREIDESKEYVDDDVLKRYLKAAKWKIVPNFGPSNQNIKTDFKSKWIPVREEDIKDFLLHFVFIVNQPTVTELELIYQRSIQDVVVENTSLKQFVDQINATGPESRDCVEKLFGLDIKPHNEEKWLSGNQVKYFIKEQQQLLPIIFSVSAMTLVYQNEIMQYGEFNHFGKIIEKVKNFLTSDFKILCVNTPVTLLSSIKISRHLNTEKIYAISVSLNILNSIKNTDCVLKAFELESTRLLTIECRHAFKDQDFHLFNKLLAKTKSNKKIILIMQQENCDICTKHFKTDFQNEGIFIIENDSIELKDFEPKDDPFIKEVIKFQGQKERVSLSDITGIDGWPSYIQSVFQGTNEQSVIDGMTLVDILSNDEIEVGSKPAGTSSLEGAYAQMYDEITVETLVAKLTSQEHNNNANDMYIISGIAGSNKQDKTDKLNQYLGRDYDNEGLKNRLEEFKNRLKTVSVNNLQVFDDQFKDRNFQEICHRYPEKRIFWICLEWENNATKFMLQEIYNPKFYLKRKFKNVIINKDLKELLIKNDLSETFVFCCVEDKPQLYKSMELNEREIRQFENNRMIRIFFQKWDAEADFKELSKQNETVHLLEFKAKQFVWCDSNGSVNYLQKYIDHKQSELQAFDPEQNEILLIEEDKLIGKIKDRKVVILADDPGMGKTTTLIKLYEADIESSSIIKSHWIIGIKLTDYLEAVRDLELKTDGIGIVNVVEFLSKMDSKLNNNLAKNILKIALDKSENFQAKPLLLVFDGFDEVLHVGDRNRILLLLKFIKNKTAAKLWITTRCHFKTLLEETLSTIAIQFSPMDDAENAQYIATYLQHRLYLTLNTDKYTELFDTDDKKQNNEKIHMYTAAFINKMKSIFRGDITTFIGTPLQLHLMLEDSEGDFKNWLEKGGSQIVDFNYVGQDVYEVYERFTYRKYGVYFQKVGIPEGIQRSQEKNFLDQYHKDFAKFRILESKEEKSLDQFSDKILLAGIIKSDDSNFQFVHKTFEEFFAAKVVIHWIEKVPNKFPNKSKQEYLLQVILMKSDYQLIRTFMNLQLQKMTEQARHDERLKHYGNVVVTMHNEQLLIDEYKRTPLHVAVKERNKSIVRFLLNSLREHPHVLTDFLFTSVELDKHYTYIPGTPLHLACISDDVEIVRILLDASAGISEDTLQKFLKYLNDTSDNALDMAAMFSNNVQLYNELLSRANNKLDLILNPESALCIACCFKNEKFVEFLLGEFKKEDCLENSSLKKILLHNSKYGNTLCYARTTTIVEKLIYVAKSMKDNNETLKNLLFPEEGLLPLDQAVLRGKFEIVKKLLNVAKEIDDDTLKQLLLSERHGESALHVAARQGFGDIINLLLETAFNLDMEILEKLITAVDVKGKNAIDLMFQHGCEEIFVDSFKMLEEDKYSNIWKRIKEMLDNLPLESRLYWDKKKLIMAIESGNIEEVNDILSNAKNSSFNPNKRLRILLLSKNKCENSTLHTACKEGNTEILKELLSYAKEIDDDSHTLKQLLLFKRNGKSALHIAAEKAHANITKLLLETASGLGIAILEELIFGVNEKGKNAILLIAEHGHETILAESFKMLKDEYPSVCKKVMEMYDNIPLERTLYSNKKKLLKAIEHDDIKKVKDILNKVTNFSVNPNESLRFLLLSKNKWANSTLHTACIKGNAEIMKELLSYAMNMDDGSETLKELLTKPTDMSPLTPLKELEHRYASEIKQIVDSLIVEARNNNRDHVVNILEQIDNQYSEAKSLEELGVVFNERSYEEIFLLTSFDSSSSSEDSDSRT